MREDRDEEWNKKNEKNKKKKEENRLISEQVRRYQGHLFFDPAMQSNAVRLPSITSLPFMNIGKVPFVESRAIDTNDALK